jgi:uncharacterized membrane protein YvbJ
MHGAAQTPVCPKCGSTEAGSLFCKTCGATLRTPIPLTQPIALDLHEPSDTWSLSKFAVIWFVGIFLVCFAMLRFDFDRHHAFKHPMSTATAFCFAVPMALLLWTGVMIKSSTLWKKKEPDFRVNE